MKRLVLLLLALIGGGLLLAAPAEAHATVVTSTPADGSRLAKAPSSVTIVFDENVGLGGIGYLHVTNGSGKRVDAGAASHPGGDATKVVDRLQGGLGDGTYTASFRVVSADSHPVAGTIRFVVGNGALARGSVGVGNASNGATGTLFDVARWITYGGLALLGGVWLLLTVWVAGRDDARARRIVWTGWGAAALGAALELLLQGPYTAGDAPSGVTHWSVLQSTLRTDYGQLHSVRLVLLGALALVLARSLRTGAERAPWESAAGVLAVGAVFTVSAGGHADTTSPNWLSIPVDMLHLLAMMTWVGGLVVLVLAVLPRREPAELREVLPVFSTAAFTSAVVLAGSGTYAAWRGIGSLDAILGTTYGLLVTGKVVLFLALMALAYLSRGVVRRRFRHPQVAYAMTAETELDDGSDTLDDGSDTNFESDDSADLDDEPEQTDSDGVDPADDPDQDVAEATDTERLRRSVYVEALVALVVLGLTSVLVAEPRGTEALAAQHREPISRTASLGSGASVTVTSDPGTHGNVQLTVDVEGRTPTQVSATATQKAKQIGPIPVKLTKAGARSFNGSADLPVAGRWEIDLVITTSRFDATTTDVVLSLY
ncbi:copper resistance CopC/CopD family protein [uncultured Jatrophihabitans sp.]|uniref:copper resistance CopC/CopD family protein n=1 Tax=uncultured Jatrophihabitans sp. TaxID=1610747 RepID=UPI0035CA2B14